MRVFRRSQSEGLESGTDRGSSGPRVTTVGAADVLPSLDRGPILVAVDGSLTGWRALEWAAAEAAARGCALRIVHSVIWPCPIPDISGAFIVDQWDSGVEALGTRVLTEAAVRAHSVDPSLPITTHMHLGATADAVLREADKDALIVLSGSCRSPSTVNSVSRHVAHRAKCSIAVVQLSDEGSFRGPSVGRVVVTIDRKGDPSAVISFAFRAAHRRGVGVTAIFAGLRWRSVRNDAQVTDALRKCAAAYPDVDVRQRVAAAPPGPAIVAESAGAALVVVGARARRRLRRALFESEDSVLHSAHSPVAIVKTQGS
jgi:nucleotide-binding universal stress UspA family protein